METSDKRALGAKLALVVAALFLVAGAVLRLYGLERNPPGFWQDEASTGIDAYLIWTTGRDRAGVLFPVIARSFGDYPLALYRYLDAPIVGLLGLTPGHERLVAAIAGTLMVLVTALLARRLIGDRAAFGALLAAACCPTWIHFSRYGSEAILLPFFVTLGWAAIERAKGTRRWGWLSLGAAALAGSAYTYHAVKLFLPLWMIGFLAYQWPLIRELWKSGQRRHVLGPALVFTALVMPSVLAAFTPEGQARGNTVLAWRHYHGWEVFRLVLNNYLAYFELGMLFVRGGPAVAQSIPGIGLWNLMELPLMVIGFVAMARGKIPFRTAAFLFFWFAIGPLPGGVTYETHNIGRVIAWLPAPQLISGIGFSAIADWALDTRHRPARQLGLAGVVALWMVTAGQVVFLTLMRYPLTTERDWQFEIGRSMECARKHRTNEQIVVAPQFQAAEVFARFYFEDLPEIAPGKPAWMFGNRDVVNPGELYVFPAGQALPNGELVCQITLTSSDSPLAFVYAGKKTPPPLPAAEIARPLVPAIDLPMVKLSTPTDRQLRHRRNRLR